MFLKECLLHSVLLVLVCNLQAQNSTWSVDLKLHGFYAYTGGNVVYETRTFNTIIYTFDGNRAGSDPKNQDKFIKKRELKGIVDYRDYLSWEPELNLKKTFFKNRFEIGLKLAYKMKRRDYDYIFSHPFVSNEPISPYNEITTQETIHYCSFGIQIGYHFRKPGIWVRAGIDRNYNNLISNEFISITYSSTGFSFKDVHSRLGFWDGTYPFAFEISKSLSDNLYTGLSFRFNLLQKFDGSVIESFELTDTNNNVVLQKGAIEMKDLMIGIHIGYRFQL